MRHLVPVATLALALSACSLTATEEDPPDATASGEPGGTVVLVTHESFSLPKPLLRAFEQESGYDLEVRASGDGTPTGSVEWLFHPERIGPLAWHGRPPGAGCPELRLEAEELQARIDAAIRTLPPRQQQVITLLDIEGWSGAEVCEILDLTEANQRVLLHRARTKVRDAVWALDHTLGAC